jgi:hypothetical protein
MLLSWFQVLLLPLDVANNRYVEYFNLKRWRHWATNGHSLANCLYLFSCVYSNSPTWVYVLLRSRRRLDIRNNKNKNF